MARKGSPEKAIEMLILNYLTSQKIFCWKTDRQGTFDPVRKTFRRNFNPHKIRGVSDILGMYKGKFFAIEVKAPKGRTSDEQATFLANIHKEGGIAFVARSIEDVKKSLFEGIDLIPPPRSLASKQH